MKKLTPMLNSRHQFGEKWPYAYVVIFAVIGATLIGFSLASQTPVAFEAEQGTTSGGAVTLTPSGASGGQAVQFGPSSAGCTVDTKLVNSCRPWLGAVASYYSMAGDIWTKSVQVGYFEKRLNNPNVLIDINAPTTITNKLDFVHFYLGPTDTVSGTVLTYATRSGSYVQLNWKPVSGSWSLAGGSDAATNANIDNMANSIKAIGPKKILLSIVHEPENDVTPGSAGTCTNTSAAGTKGSPSDYVNMWHNVRARFNALGVTNVVWNMNYMGYSYYNCLVPLLWPGNNYVDWITYDPYAGGATSFADSLKTFYGFLETSSDTTHDYKSKAWGLGEHGYWDQNNAQNSTDAQYLVYWQQAKQVVTTNAYPRLKLYSVFDASPDSTLQPTTYKTGSFVGLRKTVDITPYPEGQAAFNDYANTLLHMGVAAP